MFRSFAIGLEASRDGPGDITQFLKLPTDPRFPERALPSEKFMLLGAHNDPSWRHPQYSHLSSWTLKKAFEISILEWPGDFFSNSKNKKIVSLSLVFSVEFFPAINS